MDANYGISIGGNANVSGSSMAAGPGAHAHSVSYGAPAGLDDVRELMADLVALVTATGSAGPDLAAARAAQAELDRPAPDRHRVRELLAALAAVAQPAGAIATAVAAVTAALG
jgi:hypothetical protein